MKKVVVLGSMNMDLVTFCERAPVGGETLMGIDFRQIPGGKGANQAVALGKLESQVIMLGKIGNDSMGKIVLESMKRNNVDVSRIEKVENISTGIAKIVVEKNGQNRILVVSGANEYVDKNYIDKNLDIISQADFLVCQLEIPLEVVKYALEKAKKLGKITILNPAPARKLDAEIIENSDYIIPNETELEIISGEKITSSKSLEEISKKILDIGVKGLLVTLGKEGSLYIDKNSKMKIPALKVEAVDTTAAGDSFIGGFVKGLTIEKSLKESILLGTKVASLCVGKKGAQPSLPTMKELIRVFPDLNF